MVRWFFRFLIGLYFIFDMCSAQDSTWSFSSRLAASFSYDNNIFESVSSPVSDQAGRALLTVSGRWSGIKSSRMSFQYRDAVEGYIQHDVENRMIHDFHGNAVYFFNQNIGLGVRFQGRTRTFFQIERGYGFIQGEPCLKLYLSSRFSGRVHYAVSRLDYVQGEQFDYTHQGWGTSWTYHIFPKLSLKLQWTEGTLDFHREAYAYNEINSTLFEWAGKEAYQRDCITEISGNVEIYCWALFQCHVGHQKNRSNNYGYSFSGPRVKLLVIKSLPWKLTAGFYWMRQWKHYADSLVPLLQLYPETETEENNYILIDFTKAFNKKQAIRLQWGWYRNESPFRNLYYKKMLFSAGYSHSF